MGRLDHLFAYDNAWEVYWVPERDDPVKVITCPECGEKYWLPRAEAKHQCLTKRP